jgi:glucosylceramidase
MPRPKPIQDDRLTFISTTESSPWQRATIYEPAFSWDMLDLHVDVARTQPHGRTMEGFGACFNELGWTSLSALADADRDSVMRELFDPEAGARFSYCRMPIGANDFATEAYSYDETDGDFALQHFTVEHDRRH